MALINCSECQKEISDKAISCPNCGNPMNNAVAIANTENEEILKFPELPSKLDIGKQIEFDTKSFERTKMIIGLEAYFFNWNFLGQNDF